MDLVDILSLEGRRDFLPIAAVWQGEIQVANGTLASVNCVPLKTSDAPVMHHSNHVT